MKLLNPTSSQKLQDSLARTGRKYVPRPLLVAAYLVAACALFAVMIPRFGLLSVALLLGALLLTATLPGAAVVRHLFHKPGVFQSAIIGTIIGLGILVLGGLAAQLTGVFFVRWVPSALVLLLWFVPTRRSSLNSEGFPKLGVAGALLAMITLLPALWAALKSQPTAWEGWYQLHHDLTFQTALVAEVSTRIPSEFPWIGEALSYPWFFHSAMGVWASTTGASAASIVFKAWPVLYVGLMPAVVAIVAWYLTKRAGVAFAAPIVVTLAHGVVFGAGLSQRFPLFQISPTRDFAHLFVLLTVLGLYKVMAETKPQQRNWWWFAVMCFGAFVAAGAKSSSLPLLMGIVFGGVCALLILRRCKWTDIAAIVALASVSVLGFMIVTPVRGHNDSIVIAPLSFRTVDPSISLVSALVSVAVLFIAVVGIWILIGRNDRENWLAASLIFGVCLAGLTGVALLGHPGLSQLYFWQGAQPLLAIGMSWAGVLIWQRHGWLAIVGGFTIFVLGRLCWLVYPKPLLVAALVAVLALVVALVLQKIESARTGEQSGKKTAVVTVLASAAFLMLVPQVIQLPVASPGGSVADSETPGSIHSSQLEAYEFIRQHADAADSIVSNKHCYYGTIQTRDCDGRWFAAAAFSERRVLIEGWAYTPKGADLDWVQDRLERNDDFYTNPSAAGRQALLDQGVGYVFVDKREPYSAELADFGALVYEGEWALVYSLK